MTPDHLLTGTHAWFAREGAAFTVPAAGTSAVDEKPGAADTIWTPMEDIMDYTPEINVDLKKVWAPAPGRLRLKRVKVSKQELMHTFTIQKMSSLMFELMFMTGPLTGSAAEQYNPIEGKEVIGWLKIQQYDDDDNLLNTQDSWVYLAISGGTTFGEDIVQPKVQAIVLHSTLNTGQLE